jgi:hypothetical protein
MDTFFLKKSDNPKKKYVIIMPDGMKHYFGQAGAKDYTLHDKDIRDARKKAYISRHRNEDWTKSNIHSSAFWAKHLLWNKPTIKESIKDVENKFNIKIKYK